MKTLEQLKAENAAAEATVEEAPPAEAIEVEAEAANDLTDDAGEAEVEAGEPTEEEPEEQEETEVESWMQEEDQTSEDSDSNTIPLAAHLKEKRKIKARLGEREDENNALRSELDSLKAQLEQMRTGAPQAQAEPQVKPMPREYDFDDDAQYQAAMAQWVQAQVQTGVAAATTASTQQAQQAQAKQQLDKAVDDHYQRAQALMQDSNIDLASYEAAELSVRQDIDSVMPGAGNSVTDALISRLGKGSEKVMYFLGRNQSARMRLIEKLKSDPSGISAAMYVAELKAERATPRKQTSRAPKPVKKINGDAAGSEVKDAKALLKKYKAAHSSRDIQAAYNVKKQAKASGVDVSNWQFFD